MTHYKTLGVPRDATLPQIKAAFRKLASQHHPDRGGDTVRAAAINDAYAVLSDTERRARYDAGEGENRAPTPEEILRQRAHQILDSAFTDALNNPDIERRGLIRSITSMLEGAIKDIDAKGAEARQVARRLERLKGKLVRKKASGDDLVAMILDGKIQAQEKVTRDAVEGAAQVREALRMLEDYEREPAAHPASHMGAYASLAGLANSPFRF